MRVVEQEDPYESDSPYLRFHLVQQILDKTVPQSPEDMVNYLEGAARFILAGKKTTDENGEKRPGQYL